MLNKLLCYFGLHNHVEVVDEQMSQDYYALAKAIGIQFITPCTYLRCTRCGHTYECRTFGIKGSCIIPKEIIK